MLFTVTAFQLITGLISFVPLSSASDGRYPPLLLLITTDRPGDECSRDAVDPRQLRPTEQ
jgi:hypothetical protein